MEIYDRLLQFTLFQGMSRADLMEVVTHTKMGFHKISSGKKIVKEGDNCNQFWMMTNGSVRLETVSDDHSCSVVETINAPYTLQPERLFGINQRYTTNIKTLASCNFITLDKEEVLLLLESQLVFRLNLINLMATDTQRISHRAWRSAPKSLRERIVRFFFDRCLYPAGPKTFNILMQTIAQELNDSRLDISRALNEMQDDGLLTLHRGRIEIPLLERLLM